MKKIVLTPKEAFELMDITEPTLTRRHHNRATLGAAIAKKYGVVQNSKANIRLGKEATYKAEAYLHEHYQELFTTPEGLDTNKAELTLKRAMLG